MLPIDEFVPLPIVWKQLEVLVGELHAGRSGRHWLLSGHELIVAGWQSRRHASSNIVVARMKPYLPVLWIVVLLTTARWVEPAQVPLFQPGVHVDTLQVSGDLSIRYAISIPKNYSTTN